MLDVGPSILQAARRLANDGPLPEDLEYLSRLRKALTHSLGRFLGKANTRELWGEILDDVSAVIRKEYEELPADWTPNTLVRLYEGSPGVVQVTRQPDSSRGARITLEMVPFVEQVLEQPLGMTTTPPAFDPDSFMNPIRRREIHGPVIGHAAGLARVDFS